MTEEIESDPVAEAYRQAAELIEAAKKKKAEAIPKKEETPPEKSTENNSPSEQYYALATVGDNSTTPFPAQTAPEKNYSLANIGFEGEDQIKAKLQILAGRDIRHTNYEGMMGELLEARDEGLDNVASNMTRAKMNMGKRHAWFLVNDIESKLARKILFKMTNYLLIAAGIIIALLSSSNPQIKDAINNLTSNPIELFGLFAFIVIDLIIYVRWYRKI